MKQKQKSNCKRLVALCLSFSILVALSSPAAAYNQANSIVPVSDKIYESEKYTEFRKLRLPSTAREVNDFASATTATAEEINGPLTLRTYEPALFSEFAIPHYELFEVSQVNGALYLQYANEIGDKIYLVYRNNALIEQTIYTTSTDTVTTIRGDDAITELNFFESALHDYTTENNAAENNTTESLLHHSMLAPAIKTNFYPVTNTFPVFRHKLLASQSKPCSALQNKNVLFKAMESRYDYREKTADWKLFAATTGLSVIALFIGKTITATSVVLSAMGVGISAADTILSNAQIYKQVKYSYYHGWQGYAYDTTSQYCDVLVKRNLKSGEFSFGLDSSDNWVWIRTIVPSSSFTNQQLIDSAHAMFNAELMDLSHFGVNNLYFSDL